MGYDVFQLMDKNKRQEILQEALKTKSDPFVASFLTKKKVTDRIAVAQEPSLRQLKRFAAQDAGYAYAKRDTARKEQVVGGF